MENYKIQYPIKDELIKIMPRLHHSEEFGAKPNLKKILVPAQQFESLITIWNFFNTFSEYLSVPKFKIEELEAALRWNGKDETKDDNSNETLGLLQLIFIRSVKLMTKDLIERHYKLENKSKAEGTVLTERFELRVFHFTRRQVDDNNLEYLWPELLRLQLRTHHFSPDGYSDPLDALLSECTPHTLNSLLPYDAKLTLLTHVIHALHHLETFKDYLVERVDSLAELMKASQEIQDEVKKVIGEKERHVKEIAATV